MSLSNASVLGQEYLAPGLVESFPRVVQIMDLLPLMGIDGKSISFARSGSFASGIGQAEIQDPGTVLADAPTNPDPSLATYPLGEVGSHFQIEDGDIDNNPYPNSLLAVQIALAKRKCLYTFCQKMAQTNSPSGGNREFAGLGDIIDTNMTVAATTPGTFLWSEFLEAMLLLSNADGTPTCIMGSRDALGEVMNAMGPSEMPYYTIHGSGGSYNVPSIFGHPLVRNDMLNGTADKEKLWFLSLGDASQQSTRRGLCAIVRPGSESDPYRVRATPLGGGMMSVDVTLPIGLSVGALGAVALYDYTSL